jgi:Hydrazine synthase alpha subunit middle domain
MIPADVPFTFQLLDKDGLMLTMAQTWHQVRPGEIRIDCGGCHAHSKPPVDFGGTTAAVSLPANLTRLPARDVEYRRDIDPIVQRACVSCHQGSTAPGGLAFTGDPFVNYRKLADAQTENLPAPGHPNSWLFPNVSKFVRVFNSSRSLLMWTLTGRRLDGWTNERWPGAPVGTISPADWARYMSDQDFLPGGTDHARLVSDAERRLVAAWIDLGTPLDRNGSYFADANKPTLAITRTAAHTAIVGAADGYSGLNVASLRITVNGTETTPIELPDGRWSITLPDGPSTVTASVSDRAGNRSILTRTLVFSPPLTH